MSYINYNACLNCVFRHKSKNKKNKFGNAHYFCEIKKTKNGYVSVFLNDPACPLYKRKPSKTYTACSLSVLQKRRRI